MEVEDAVQEAFVRLYAREFRLLKSFNPERSSLATFLRVIASSAAIDLLRKHKNLPAAVEPAALAADERTAGSIDTLPEFDINLDGLTDRQRLILRLLFHAQMDVRDVAKALRITEQTVRSSKHKALERLRATHAPDREAPEPTGIAGDASTADRV